MKIDESSIDHNVFILAAEISGNIWDIIGEDNEREMAIASLAYINGVCDLSDKLREVLKA